MFEDRQNIYFGIGPGAFVCDLFPSSLFISKSISRQNHILGRTFKDSNKEKVGRRVNFYVDFRVVIRKAGNPFIRLITSFNFALTFQVIFFLRPYYYIDFPLTIFGNFFYQSSRDKQIISAFVSLIDLKKLDVWEVKLERI